MGAEESKEKVLDAIRALLGHYGYEQEALGVEENSEGEALNGEQEAFGVEKNSEENRRDLLLESIKWAFNRGIEETNPEDEVAQTPIVKNWIKKDLIFAYIFEKLEKERYAKLGKTYAKRNTAGWIGAAEQIIEAAKNRREYEAFVDVSPERKNEDRMTPGEYEEYIERFKKDDPKFAEKLEEARSNGQENKIINEH